MNKVDKQLGLKNRNCTSASRISAQNLSRDLKQELGDWRQQKADNETKQRDEQIALEQAEKMKIKRKQQKIAQEKRELVEEFKFQKEMAKQKQNQLDEMEKVKSKVVVSKEQSERINKREMELKSKRNELIQKREEATQVKDVKDIGQELYKGKVESKLLKETVAMELKKRDKYDRNRDGSRDCITMGGRLPNVSSNGPIAPQVRSVPSWRQGV